MVNFSVDQLVKKVSSYENKGDKGKGSWAKTAFLPEGKHRGRIIVDTQGEVFTSYYAYGFFNKGVRDPRAMQAHELPENFKDELYTVAQTLADRGKWKFRSKEVFITPFYLEWTDSKSENWEPGNLYYVIGNKKFSSSLLKFLKSVATDNPQAIQQLLDPSVSAPLLEIQMTGGQSGGCNIGVAFPQKMGDPIDLTQHTYVSLEEAYIRPEFNLEKYNVLLQAAKEELANTPEKSDKEEADNSKEFNAQPAPQTTTASVATSIPEPTEQVATRPVVTDQPAQAENKPANPWDKFRQQHQ